MIEWSSQGQAHTAQWRSESGASAPRRVIAADDTLPADTAYRMACEGTGLLWTGDFQNARMLLQALMRRADRKPRICMLRTVAVAGDEHAARLSLVRDYVLSFAGRLPVAEVHA